MEKTKRPSEVLDLPSKGHFYPTNNPLSSGKIEILLPTARHEDILTSRKLITQGTVIDSLLESLIVDKNINYNDLLLVDKNGLTLAARMLLYGPKYKTSVKCQICDENNIEEYDISEFESKDIDLEQYPAGINNFLFTLPTSKINIEFKLLTVGDEKSINNELKNNRKIKTNVDSEITTRLSYVIIKYGNETNRQKIKHLISTEMLTLDSRAFREHVADIAPNIDMSVNFQCSSCGNTSEFDLPLDTQFFWPTKRL